MKKSNLDKLQKARSLNDVLGIVDSIKKKIETVGKSTNRLLKGLSSSKALVISLSANEIELGDIANQPRPTQSKKGGMRTVLDKIKAPSPKDLSDNSSAIEELNDAIEDLNAAIRILSSKTFSKMDESKKAIESIKHIIREAGKIKREQLNAMQKLSRNYMPKEHSRQVKILEEIVENSIPDENYTGLSINSFVLSPSKDHIYFQTFVTVEDLSNAEGFIYENYSYVYTSVLDLNTSELAPHITSLKDPKVPGTFPIGIELDSLKQLKAKILAINHIDELNSVKSRTRFGTAKQRQQMQRKGSIISEVSRHIKKVRFHNKNLYVQYSKSISPREKSELLETLFPLIRSIFLRKKTVNGRRTPSANLTYKEAKSSRSGNPYFVFSLSSIRDDNVKSFVKQVSELAKRLDLSTLVSQQLIQSVINDHEPEL